MLVDADFPVMGIIPACAGSTGGCFPAALVVWDHPRMRGEHTSATLRTIVAGGSSPHARGALALNSFLSDGYRIIPACAGSTPS